MAQVSTIEAAAEVERRRAMAATLLKAKKLSRGQQFLLRDIDRYHPGGYSTEDQVRSKTLEILHERFAYLDRQRVPRRDLGDGRFVLAYWRYAMNEDGIAALIALGIRLEVEQDKINSMANGR